MTSGVFGMKSRVSDSELVQAALKARERAYAPYSGYRVGAALLCGDGRVFTGCNVENASYGLSICAERVAVFKAVSAGCRDFAAIAVAGSDEDFCRPCGACRQVLAEFAPDLRVLTADRTGRWSEHTLAQLLPEAFSLTGRGRES